MSRPVSINLSKCNSVADEIVAFTPLNPRHRYIFLSRVVGPCARSRASDGMVLGISDERVRQIETALCRNLVTQMLGADFVHIPKVLAASASAGNPVSWLTWEKAAGNLESNALGSFPEADSDLAQIDVFRRMVYLLRTFLINGGKNTEVLGIPSGLKNALAELRMADLPHLFEPILVSAEQRREIARKVNDAGAVDVQYVIDLLGCDSDTAREVMRTSGYTNLGSGWFSFASLDRYAKSVFVNACAKMSRACDSMPVSVLRDGVVRAAKRYAAENHGGLVVPPLEVFAGLLTTVGFDVDANGHVTMNKDVSEVGGLNKAESVFLDAIRQIGPVLSIYDLAEFLHDRDLSVSSVNNVLIQWSPLLEKVKAPTSMNRGRAITFFKLRGSLVSGADLNSAVTRNFCEGSDPNLEVQTNGCGDYYVTVGRYMLLTGVFNGSKLENFAGPWQLVDVEGQSLGDVNVLPPSAWGADDLAAKLDLVVGTRLRFHFDPRTRTAVVQVMSKPAAKQE